MVVNKHTKKGTKIGCYATNSIKNSVSIFDISNNEFDIEIPQHCKYARGNKWWFGKIKNKNQCHGHGSRCNLRSRGHRNSGRS